MIKGMPQHAQTAIKNYQETGSFKDQVKVPTFQDAEENKATVQNFRANIDEFIGADNEPGVDSDPRDGYISFEGGFSVSGQYQNNADGSREMFQNFGGAIIYVRDTKDFVENITTSENPEHDQGVQHYDANDHTKSFMTMDSQDV